jgi:hypothetical protein
VVQCPRHGNAGHHDNAALLGGRDQAFHGNLPVLALGFRRWQRKDISAGVAEGSEFAAIAGRDRIVKLADQPFWSPLAPRKLFIRFKKRCRQQLAASG